MDMGVIDKIHLAGSIDLVVLWQNEIRRGIHSLMLFSLYVLGLFVLACTLDLLDVNTEELRATLNIFLLKCPFRLKLLSNIDEDYVFGLFFQKAGYLFVNKLPDCRCIFDLEAVRVSCRTEISDSHFNGG